MMGTESAVMKKETSTLQGDWNTLTTVAQIRQPRRLNLDQCCYRHNVDMSGIRPLQPDKKT